MHQFHTWKEFEPHTVWEAYSPTRHAPSSCKYNSGEPYVKPDFCGWSALGPVNLIIENLLGIRADGVGRVVRWRLHQTCRHGIRDLQFGGVSASLLYDGGGVTVETSAPFLLEINGRQYAVEAGTDRISL